MTTAGKLFADMCREVLSEASTTGDIIKTKPGGSDVMKTLHTEYSTPHDLKFSKIEKISWSELKDYSRNSWVIIIGTNGTGAIKTSDNTYHALASTGDGEVSKMRNERGGNILDFLKGRIGKLREFHVALKQADTSRKKRDREELNKKDQLGAVSQETLTKKFKPLWAKAIQAAIADIKGHVANQIKNDAFAKAKKKLAHIEALQDALDNLDNDRFDQSFIRTSVNTAVLMAASHHYPDQTGTIGRGYSNSYSAQHSEGTQLLLKDISNGDQKKLGTVLAFFKRALISG